MLLIVPATLMETMQQISASTDAQQFWDCMATLWQKNASNHVSLDTFQTTPHDSALRLATQLPSSLKILQLADASSIARPIPIFTTTLPIEFASPIAQAPLSHTNIDTWASEGVSQCAQALLLISLMNKPKTASSGAPMVLSGSSTTLTEDACHTVLCKCLTRL